jgi:hypothetical protein
MDKFAHLKDWSGCKNGLTGWGDRAQLFRNLVSAHDPIIILLFRPRFSKYLGRNPRSNLFSSVFKAESKAINPEISELNS